tara:strand:- start:873 stop:1685 length:813 start_codon:yes stop_codon:yes gene_type:complete
MDPNEKLTGIASMMPQGGPPMGPPPGMGGGQPPMPMGGGGPSPMPMSGEEPSMDPMMGAEEPPMNVEQDAMMLAEAVVGRTQGDVQSAIDVLDTAKAMLMSSGSQEPQMMMDGGPMYANMGKPLYAKMGKPLYAESGRSISNSDSDTLRQIIMDDLAQMAAAANTQLKGINKGRTISDEDLEFYKNLLNQGQEGRSLSNEDLKMIPSLFRNMTGENMPPLMREGGGELNPGLQALQKERPDVVKKILGKADGGTLMSGNAMAELDRYRFG